MHDHDHEVKPAKAVSRPTAHRVLIIAGSDPSGGAGIQADIKTITCLGGYAMSAITAITVQNTMGVSEVFGLAPRLVKAQAMACLEDIGADVIKTGMLGDVALIETVAELIADGPKAFYVLDPVMVAKGGHPLLPTEATQALSSCLLPLSGLLTPNAPEAGHLTGIEVTDETRMRRSAEKLLRLGAGAVLMKGGHIDGSVVIDWLVTPHFEQKFSAPRVQTRHTHGTGCTLASACAALYRPDQSLGDMVEKAHAYVQGAIAHAPQLGKGHGPLGHGWQWPKS